MLDNKIELKRFIFECIKEYQQIYTFHRYGQCKRCKFNNGDTSHKPINDDDLCERCEEQ